jgi:hypothetical protein
MVKLRMSVVLDLERRYQRVKLPIGSEHLEESIYGYKLEPWIQLPI